MFNICTFVDMRKILKNPNHFSDAEAAKLLKEVTSGKTAVMSSFQKNITNKQKDETLEQITAAVGSNDHE